MIRVFYSGAMHQWGLTIPIFSRGRWISNRQLDFYNVGILYAPPVDNPGDYYRALYVYNDDAQEAVSSLLRVLGPYPTTRQEMLRVALASETPTFFIPYLANPTMSPSVVGGWTTNLAITIPPRSAIPIWLRLSIPVTATPTSDAYFTLSVNDSVVSHIVYTYKTNHAILPLDLWVGGREGYCLSDVISDSGVTPSPAYSPGGFILSSASQVLVSYPVQEGFAESDFARKLIRVLALAIGEFWLRADAAVRYSEIYSAKLSDALTFFGVPIDNFVDAVVNVTDRISQVRGDALVHFARQLVEEVADALAHFGLDVYSYRGDALLHLGWERLGKGDSLAFVAQRMEEKRADTFLRLLSVDDILQLQGNLFGVSWGFFILAPLAVVNIRNPYPVSIFRATQTSGEESRIMVLESEDGRLWAPVGLIPEYPDYAEAEISGRYIRIRNENGKWCIIVWALARRS